MKLFNVISPIVSFSDKRNKEERIKFKISANTPEDVHKKLFGDGFFSDSYKGFFAYEEFSG